MFLIFFSIKQVFWRFIFLLTSKIYGIPANEHFLLLRRFFKLSWELIEHQFICNHSSHITHLNALSVRKESRWEKTKHAGSWGLSVKLKGLWKPPGCSSWKPSCLLSHPPKGLVLLQKGESWQKHSRASSALIHGRTEVRINRQGCLWLVSALSILSWGWNSKQL